MGELLSCDVVGAGVGAESEPTLEPSTSTPPPTVYVRLTHRDSKPEFKAQFVFAGESAKNEMLAVALAAITSGLPVLARVTEPSVTRSDHPPYSTLVELLLDTLG